MVVIIILVFISSTGTGMVNLIHRNAGDPSSNLGGPTTLSSYDDLKKGRRYYGC